MELDSVANKYFMSKASELREKGFVILEGVGSDSGVPSNLSFEASLHGGEVIEEWIEYYE